MLTDMAKRGKIQRVKVMTPCDKCKRQMILDRALRAREPLPRVKELGLLCPHCQHWRHYYYETDAMRAAQPVGRKDEDKAAYKALYDAEQEKIKAELEPQICFPAG